MTATKAKKLFLVSTFPLIVLLTFGIFPFVMSIILLINSDKFENKGLAIATGILGIITVLIPFIMGFFLKAKIETNNTSVNSTQNTEY